MVMKVLLELLKRLEVRIRYGTWRILVETNIISSVILRIEEPDILKLFLKKIMKMVLFDPKNIVEIKIKNGTWTILAETNIISGAKLRIEEQDIWKLFRS